VALALLAANVPSAAGAQVGADPGRAPSQAAADTDDARREGLHLLPVALPAYQPETSWMLGGAAILVDEPPAGSGRKESQLMLLAAASVRGQLSVALTPEWYLAGDRVQITGTASFSLFPDLFYGIGNATHRASEEHYTPRFGELAITPAFRLAPALYLGPTIRLQLARMSELETGGQLASGSLAGWRGGTTVQLGATAAWDTRDSVIYPRSGTLVRLQGLSAAGALGSSFDFNLLRLDARVFFNLPWLRHLVAAQALLEVRDGEPPFYDTGRLGGESTMRGFYTGRYRDRQLAAVQVEYRAPLFWRMGAVGFASAGNVARAPSGLRDGVKVAGGLGLRFAPLSDIPVNLRLDLAYGDGAAFYFGMGEAF
jgi:hypothetical protein